MGWHNWTKRKIVKGWWWRRCKSCDLLQKSLDDTFLTWLAQDGIIWKNYKGNREMIKL